MSSQAITPRIYIGGDRQQEFTWSNHIALACIKSLQKISSSISDNSLLRKMLSNWIVCNRERSEWLEPQKMVHKVKLKKQGLDNLEKMLKIGRKMKKILFIAAMNEHILRIRI